MDSFETNFVKFKEDIHYISSLPEPPSKLWLFTKLDYNNNRRHYLCYKVKFVQNENYGDHLQVWVWSKKYPFKDSYVGIALNASKIVVVRELKPSSLVGGAYMTSGVGVFDDHNRMDLGP